MCNLLLSAVVVGAMQTSPDIMQVDFLQYYGENDFRVQTVLVDKDEYEQCANSQLPE